MRRRIRTEPFVDHENKTADTMVCMYECMYVCMCTSKRCVCMYLTLKIVSVLSDTGCWFVCMYMHVCMFVFMYVYVCMYVYMFVCLYICMFVCVYVCMQTRR